MKAEKFSESLNQINDKYIEEAAAYQADAAQAGNSAATSMQAAAQKQAGTAASADQFRNGQPGRTVPNAAYGNNAGGPPYGPSGRPVYPAPEPQKKSQVKGLKVWRIIAIAACALLAVGITVTAIGLISDSAGSYSYKEEAYAPYPDAEDQAGAGGAYFAEPSESFAEGERTEEAGISNDGITSGAAGSYTTPMPTGENTKIIYTANLSVETTDFPKAQETISAVTEKHHGYFENMELNNGTSSYRSAYYRIRIPAEELDAFLNESESFGNITSVSRNAEDVSEYYYDTEARLESAKAKLKRLQELYQQAQDMSDIITIESEISNVEWEIDSLSGELQHYDSQVEYSTVTLNLKEVYQITEEAAPLTFGERISKGFKDGLRGFGSAMEDLAVWIVENWLWLLLVIIVIVAAIVIPIKLTTSDGKNKKDRPDQNQDSNKQ